MTPLSSETAVRDHILRLAKKLPTSPHIFGRLGRLLNDPNSELSDIVKLVAVDSGLTGRVIRLSNSVFFRGEQAVRSLDEAINRVGFREMHRIVGVAMSEQIFQGGLPVYNLTAEQLWENSVVTALSMERLARVSGEDEGEAYTVGLLRSIGKLVLDMLISVEHHGISCPESETLDLVKWERAWAAITSNETGAMILEEWKMTGPIAMAVRDHYRPSADSGRMSALLHIACWVCHQLGKGMTVETRQWELTPETLTLAGMTQEQAEACVAETQEALSELKTRLKG
jgi:HD-like signal output (HDOD) protein